jgi:uncharacterized protein (TIGR03437 family)
MTNHLLRNSLLLCAAFAACGVTAYAQKPAIATAGVLDAASYTANIAQGSLFVVKGTNLSTSGLKYGTKPLPTILDGTRITFTPAAGGTGTDAYLIYYYNLSGVNQLAAVLPSTLATGSYNVTVTYNGTVSDAVKATVVARKFGIITVDGSGSGRAVVQNYVSASQYDLNRFTTGTVSGYTMSPAKPGQLVVLWGTGLGPISKADNEAPGAIDLRSSVDVKVIVGGKTLTPDAYAGRAPEFPGTDEIIFTLPADVQTGCNVPLQVSAGGTLSNATTVSIATGTACTNAQFDQTTLTKLDQGGTLVTGSFVLSSLSSTMTVEGVTASVKSDSLTGLFARYTADQMGDASGLLGTTSTCQVYHRTGDQTALLVGSPAVLLDAGSSLTLTGPNSLSKPVPQVTGSKSYYLSLGTSYSIPGMTIPGSTASVIVAGSYSVKGTGGTDVGAFTAPLTIGTPVTVGTIADTIVRSSSYTVTWTPGAATDLVAVTGVAGTVTGGTSANPLYDSSVFVCTTTADKGTLTVPASILSQLPAVSATAMTAGTGIGMMLVTTSSTPAANNGLFTAPLVAGGNTDLGMFVATVGSSKTVAFQ